MVFNTNPWFCVPDAHDDIYKWLHTNNLMDVKVNREDVIFQNDHDAIFFKLSFPTNKLIGYR